ncbi:hypothetical protein Ocin01_01570 [Orchesella cincta]|uniref:TAZ-type domain-containing protein n=1 Tax=Orchesella cincta TaxID=48709 RepID=A0A1D2NIJ1_ORCCI|nr:hypothetical protein Ocin01_01570 [Orchesella cincta]
MVPRVGTPQAGGNLKLIQCQLMLLLHARRCQQRKELMISTNRQATVTNNMARAILLNCPIRHCRAMKEVLDHMKSGLSTVPMCAPANASCQRVGSDATSELSLHAARRSASKQPSPPTVPPNCHVAEQAEEGQSGVPCQGQDELRPRPIDGNDAQEQDQRNDCDKPINDNMEKTTAASSSDAPTPSLDQVRSAYEQLGIPCPESALKRLMATLPSSSRHRAKRHHHEISKSRPAASMMDTAENNDEGNPDHGVFDCSTHSPASTASNSDSDPEPPSPSSNNRIPRHYQQPLISSTTTNPTISSRLPFKSSSCSRPS